MRVGRGGVVLCAKFVQIWDGVNWVTVLWVVVGR